MNKIIVSYVIGLMLLTPMILPSKSLAGEERSSGMILVKGGCFQMGDAGKTKDEKPVHEVCLEDYYISDHEMTQGEWEIIMGSNPSRFKSCGKDCPVENVSWDDVLQFIEKLNTKMGSNYRLPTEAEWEYAASSGGKKEKWSGTSNEKELYKYSNFCDKNCKHYWKDRGQDDGYKTTSPVKSFLPNSFGLYDMGGNVLEWLEDWYVEDYYQNSTRNNPKGPDSGSYRVNRGGSWGDGIAYLRAANRFSNSPDRSRNNLGFRLAKSPVN